MINITINSSSGQFLLSAPVNTGAKGYYSLMQHDYITLPFSLQSPVEFGIGSYADLREAFSDALGGKLAKIYKVCDLQTPTYNTATGGYDYTLRLDAYYWLWKNKVFKYTPEAAGQEASWSLTASLDVHLGVFLRNLDALGETYGEKGYEFSIDSTVENKAVAITYDNTNLIDALSRMAEAWNCEWWVTENVIHFGRLENGDAVELETGVNAESMTRNESKGTYATRIYAFGSTRNIPENYRPNNNEDLTVNGVVQKRLMLPAGTPYIDARPGLTEQEVVESVVVFDDIYPRRVGTLSDVKTVDRAIENEDGNQTGTFKAYQYKDTGLTFDESYIIEGEELRIVFQSGKLNGLDFGVTFNPNDADPAEQLWEIVANEDYGRRLPDEVMKPENGDTYILYGFNIKLVSDQYIPAAEQELKAKAEEYVAKTQVDDGTYTVPLYSSWVKEDEVNRTFDAGQRIKLKNPAYFGTSGRTSRVIGWEMCLDIPYDRPVYTIGESAQYSRLGELEDKVDSLTLDGQAYQGIGGGSGVYLIRTNDSTPASNSNAYSALRSRLEFLAKTRPETMPFLMTFLQGAIFGKDGFASGLTGFGAKMDEYGNGEMENLFIRRSLTVPLLVYNRVDVQMGDKWRAPGVGIIDTVDTENKICTLKLEDGEIGAVKAGDICMGIYHAMNSDDNATEDYDDSRGNRRFAGFCTVYFTITEVMGERNEQFKYQVRPVSERWTTSFDPFEQMTFVAYGSFTDEDRQSSVYETRTYTRMLWKQNTWEIASANIALQYGDLSNLNVHGMQMTGYSMYLNSVYFTGTIMQTKPDGTPVRTANDRGAWAAGHYDFYDRVSHDGCIWLCVNEDGTDTEPAEGNPDWLLQVRKGDDGEPGPQGVPGTDGKDGKTYYTWIRYADDAQGTGISNNPTGKEYIGFAYNKETATESNNPLDYTWSLIKGEKGDDGTSLVNMGGWYTGLFVPYMGIVRMGGASWQCINKNGTSNPPLWTITDKDNNRLLQTQDSGKTYGYILTGEENTAEYVLVARDGTDGAEGVPGTPGKDGKTLFTWIRYADDAQGTGISDHPSGKAFIGFAYNKESSLESNNPEDYTWSDIKGEQGVPGEKGADGTQYYTWIAYSDNADGSGMYQQPKDSTLYIGIAVNKTTATESTNPADYTWSRFKGEKGDKGDQGPQGIPGEKGADGKTKYTWIRYADNAQGGGISNDPTGKSYIGLSYNRDVPNESNDPTDYTWSLIKGEKGDQGVPGEKGADGTQYYTWIAYSDNADGSGMYQQPKDSTLYIGIAVNKTTATESTNPTDYTWSRFKGEKGDKGDQGIPGPKGEDGTQYWTWVAYSDNADGSNMYQVPNEDTKYIGIAVNKLTQTESSDPADYTWSKFKGEDGAGISNLGNWYTGLFVPYLGIVRMGYGSYMCINKNGTSNPPLWTITDNAGNRLLLTQDGGKTYGYILTGEMNTSEYVLVAADGADGVNGVDGIQGPKGEDGRTTYFHVKYSANPDGNPMSETPSVYIGTYVDYTEEDSDDYTKYTWSRFQGLQGEQGIPGTDGTNGITYYWHIKYSNDGGATFTANNGETPGKFMGTLVDTNPTDSSTPSAYKWAEIKGDKGDQGDKGDKGDKGEDGTSVSHHGDWKTGKFIPYMGIVRMGGSSWICINANGTSNPPCWTITDSAGNRLLQTQDGGRTYGYILTGENNTAEYDLVAEDGKPGADGKPGDKGEQGLQGCILRRSEWKTGTEYRNDEALTSGTRYLDVALVQDNNAATGWRAYKCRQTHTSSSANAPGTSGGNTYWEEFGINTTAIFTSLIIAKDALINFMSGNQLLIRKDDGTVTIGLTGGYNNKAYIWAGGTTPDNARFRVDELGKAVMTDSEVHGTIYAISGQIGGFTIVGNSLQNTGDGYITITNGKRMAGIGGGLAGILGYDAAGVFRNEETYSLPAGTVNIAAYLSASGAQYNFAFQGRGNGVLSGIMEGYALNYVDNTSANVTDLTRGKYIEMNTPSGNVAHVLPRKTHVEGVLGVSSTTAFAVLLHYFGKYESGGSFTLYGRTTSVSGANTAEFPYLYDHNGNNVSVQIAKGDSAEVLLVYDGAQYFAQLLNVRN